MSAAGGPRRWAPGADQAGAAVTGGAADRSRGSAREAQRMRLGDIIAEARANLRAGVTGALWSGLAVGLIVVLTTWLDTTATTALLRQSEDYQLRGANTWIIQAEARIDGRACDALAAQPGIRAAGALAQQSGGLRLAQLPGSPVTWFWASPGFATVLPQSSGQSAAGPLLPTDLADALGVTPGQTIVVDGQVVPVGGTYVYPDDGRPPGMAHALVMIAGPGQVFNECWVDLVTWRTETRDLLFTAVSLGADSANPPQLYQHNRSLGQLADLAVAFRSRSTAWLWSVVLGATAAVGFLACWRRRLEFASALHCRQPKVDLVAGLSLEALAWALPACLASAPVIAFLTSGTTAANQVALALTAAALPVAGLIGVLGGTWLGAALVRERHLFTYFKDR